MAKSKSKWVTIQSKSWGDNWQSNDYHEILKCGEHKLQIRLHHDYAYPTKQSYARVERWDGTKWHPVASEGQPSFPSVRGDYLTQKTDFKPMRDKLLKLAEVVLF